jgi:hypothetical protein
MKLLTTILFVLIFFNLHAQFTINTYSVNSANPYGILVGKGRNDGLNRIYLTTKAGKVQEWTWNGRNGWNMLNIPTPASLVINKLIYLTLGDARNDEKNRLYFAQFAGGTKVYESVFVNNQWQTIEIGTETGNVGSLIIDDLVGDNVKKLYVSGISGVFEYKWNATAGNFSRTFLGKGGNYGSEGPNIITDIRGTGSKNMYLCGSTLYELNKNSNDYSISPILQPNDYTEMVVAGAGRNDSKNRLYFANSTGRLEYSWINNTWERTELASSGDGRSAINVAKIHNDGKDRVYMSQPLGNLTEYTWDNTGQNYTSRQVIDATSGATSLIATGNARNDNIIRMYVPAYSKNKLYEITSNSPLISQIAAFNNADQFVKFHSTLFQSTLSFQLFDEALISIYDISGKCVLSKMFFHGNHQILSSNWHSGFYIIQAHNLQNKLVFKVLKL